MQAHLAWKVEPMCCLGLLYNVVPTPVPSIFETLGRRPHCHHVLHSTKIVSRKSNKSNKIVYPWTYKNMVWISYNSQHYVIILLGANHGQIMFPIFINLLCWYPQAHQQVKVSIGPKKEHMPLRNGEDISCVCQDIWRGHYFNYPTVDETKRARRTLCVESCEGSWDPRQ